MKMHGSQLRASGDPYFAHPIQVAGILTDYRLDTATIVTALLHDVVEDTSATRDDIAGMFGEEVAGLVAFLASDDSTYCNGGFYTVDGALTAA